MIYHLQNHHTSAFNFPQKIVEVNFSFYLGEGSNCAHDITCLHCDHPLILFILFLESRYFSVLQPYSSLLTSLPYAVNIHIFQNFSSPSTTNFTISLLERHWSFFCCCKIILPSPTTSDSSTSSLVCGF